MNACWTGTPDSYVGLEVGTLGTVRKLSDPTVVPYSGDTYSAVFTWKVPGYDDEEIHCNSEEYEVTTGETA